jgi:hypothetical protein
LVETGAFPWRARAKEAGWRSLAGLLPLVIGQASVVLCADFKFARGVKQSDDGRNLEADISVFRLPFFPLPVAEKL